VVNQDSAANCYGSLELKAAKARGEVCKVWDCFAAHPQHAIVWKCAAGHRQVNWYCRPCAERMAVIASHGAQDVCTEPVGEKNQVVLWCGQFRSPVSETGQWFGARYGSMSASTTLPSGRMYST
jgi:hypothetical protein